MSDSDFSLDHKKGSRQITREFAAHLRELADKLDGPHDRATPGADLSKAVSITTTYDKPQGSRTFWKRLKYEFEVELMGPGLDNPDAS